VRPAGPKARLAYSIAAGARLAKDRLEHQRAEARCPWQNGRIERFFGTLKDTLPVSHNRTYRPFRMAVASKKGIAEDA
jgi:transposase InsO family protein